MFIFGYCYPGSDSKPAGFRPEGTVTTVLEAKTSIKEKLAGKKVTFEESAGKFRAYADGYPTGYIYLKVQAEMWIAIDKAAVGTKGDTAVFAKGSLPEVKDKARKFLDRDVPQDDPSPDTVYFDRTGDNIEVKAKYAGQDRSVPTDVVLIRVG